MFRARLADSVLALVALGRRVATTKMVQRALNLVLVLERVATEPAAASFAGTRRAVPVLPRAFAPPAASDEEAREAIAVRQREAQERAREVWDALAELAGEVPPSRTPWTSAGCLRGCSPRRNC